MRFCNIFCYMYTAPIMSIITIKASCYYNINGIKNTKVHLHVSHSPTGSWLALMNR